MTGHIVYFILILLSNFLYSSEPFNIFSELVKSNENVLLKIAFECEEGAYIYANTVDIKSDNISLRLVQAPCVKKEYDPLFNKEIEVYDGNFIFLYDLTGITINEFEVTIKYQGCKNGICFVPQQKRLMVKISDRNMFEAKPTKGNYDKLLKKFVITGRGAGFVSPEDFVKFLNDSKKGKEENLKSKWKDKSLIAVLFFVFISGMGLNLTPCVLPLIPVYIAIISAGNIRKRWLSLFIGLFYGVGIMITYGIIGMLVVKGMTRFGNINSSPYFNFFISFIFFILSGAVIGLINIDFSSLQMKFNISKITKLGILTGFILGSMNALLAGSCVAPVVLATLIFSSNLYNEGVRYAIFIPFLLGTGMAIPWPFLFAGFSFLPRPGKWMRMINILFASILIFMAGYYSYLGYCLLKPHELLTDSKFGDWIIDINEGLREADRLNKPLFVDFWAEWCTSCRQMNKKTFSDPRVKEALEDFIKVKIRIDNFDVNDRVGELLDYFDVKGIPAYFVMVRRDDE